MTLLLAVLLAVATHLPPARARAVDGVLTAWMAKSGIPGASLAIVRDGRIVYQKGYGLADVENHVAATPATAYRTASIGKTLTATAVLRLSEAGKLDLDAPVQRYCPAFPQKQWPLSTRNLLRHMGGIRHYGGPHDHEEQFSTRHYAGVAESLEPFRDDPLLYEPGTQSTYSTYGFDIAGCAVEGAAGLPYVRAMQTLVFDPAGMTSTRDDDPAAIIPNRAAGYIHEKGALRNAFHVDMSNRLPAGGFITTVGDLARFAANFIDCKLVSCPTRDAMLAEQRLTNRDVVNYGLGWAIDEDAAGHVTGAAFHGGSSPGVSGMLYIVPKERLAVVVLTNLEDAPERLPTMKALAAAAVR
jgi:serine beta-lactamase-like protein LACTB